MFSRTRFLLSRQFCSGMKEGIKSDKNEKILKLDTIMNYLSTTKENKKRVISGLLVVTVTGTGLTIYNWDSVKRIIGLEGAKVAQETLKSNELIGTTTEFTKKVIKDALNDKETLEMSKIYLDTIINDPTTQNNLVNLLNIALQNETFRKQSLMFVSDLLKSPEVQENVTVLFKNVLANEVIYDEVSKLVQNILCDPTIQTKSGDHIWNASKKAITPSVFSSKPKE